jgi:hypothetical protein
MVVPFAAGLMTAPAPAGGAEPVAHGVRLAEKSGFTPGVLDDVRVGDWIFFVLDMENSVSEEHSVTFDDQSMCPGAPGSGRCWPELRFNDTTQSCSLGPRELPFTRCFMVRSPVSVTYHDRLGLEKGGPDFQGLIRMAGSSPPTTPTTAAPTTTTTAAPTTTTTRPVTTTTTHAAPTTTAPTTATTAPTTIRPFLIEPPTTTTTGAGANAAGSGKNGAGSSPTTGAKDKNKDKNKDGNKDDSPTSSTTETTVAPDDAFFDSASLTPGPVTLPDSLETAEGVDMGDLDAAAVMDLLDPEESDDDDGTRIVLMAGAALGLLVLGGGLITWFHRSSRYFPA